MSKLISEISRMGAKCATGPMYSLVRRAAFTLDPETAHAASLSFLKSGLLAGFHPNTDKRLRLTVFGVDFPNPLGVAAGYDKNAEVVRPLLDMGFGFVETGTVTPKPQAGNPAPRVFRLTQHEAMINRLGFNGEGHDAVFARVRNLETDKTWFEDTRRGRFGINVAANRQSHNFIDDYVQGIRKFGSIADFITINVSSPNTPGLRDLQQEEALKRLLSEVVAARASIASDVPLILKIAPDLSLEELDIVCEQGLLHGVAAISVGNTTLSRPGLDEAMPLVGEAGGLSGKPLRELALQMLRETYQRVGGTIALIGVGGVDGPASAIERIRSGASLIQLYTAMVYHGPAIVAAIVNGLSDELSNNGLNNVSDLIGIDAGK